MKRQESGAPDETITSPTTRQRSCYVLVVATMGEEDDKVANGEEDELIDYEEEELDEEGAAKAAEDGKDVKKCVHRYRAIPPSSRHAARRRRLPCLASCCRTTRSAQQRRARDPRRAARQCAPSAQQSTLVMTMWERHVPSSIPQGALCRHSRLGFPRFHPEAGMPARGHRLRL